MLGKNTGYLFRIRNAIGLSAGLNTICATFLMKKYPHILQEATEDPSLGIRE